MIQAHNEIYSCQIKHAKRDGSQANPAFTNETKTVVFIPAVL